MVAAFPSLFPAMSSPNDPGPSRKGYFPNTQWTQIIRPAQGDDPRAALVALQAFCEEYRGAIRSFFRGLGLTEADAEDLTQAFLHDHVVSGWENGETLVHRARREPGRRFRAFLCSALRHFLTDWQRANRAQKRGGDRVISLDGLLEEGAQVGESPGSGWERRFDLDYARAMLRRVTEALRHSEQNLAMLTRGKSQAQVAEELGMTENSVKQMHHQFRRRFALLLRAEVERTVGPEPGEVEDELRYLMSLFGDLT